jgi:hypothetical protein
MYAEALSEGVIRRPQSQSKIFLHFSHPKISFSVEGRGLWLSYRVCQSPFLFCDLTGMRDEYAFSAAKVDGDACNSLPPAQWKVALRSEADTRAAFCCQITHGY